jgi:hypothetical protein
MSHGDHDIRRISESPTMVVTNSTEMRRVRQSLDMANKRLWGWQRFAPSVKAE